MSHILQVIQTFSLAIYIPMLICLFIFFFRCYSRLAIVRLWRPLLCYFMNILSSTVHESFKQRHLAPAIKMINSMYQVLHHPFCSTAVNITPPPDHLYPLPVVSRRTSCIKYMSCELWTGGETFLNIQNWNMYFQLRFY